MSPSISDCDRWQRHRLVFLIFGNSAVLLCRLEQEEEKNHLFLLPSDNSRSEFSPRVYREINSASPNSRMATSSRVCSGGRNLLWEWKLILQVCSTREGEEFEERMERGERTEQGQRCTLNELCISREEDVRGKDERASFWKKVLFPEKKVSLGENFSWCIGLASSAKSTFRYVARFLYSIDLNHMVWLPFFNDVQRQW